MAPHWTGLLIIGLLALLLFGGRGKISSVMGDFAKGITAFRKGLKDDESEEAEQPESGAIGEERDRTAAGEDNKSGS